MYRKYVPAFEKLYKDAGLTITFSAKSFVLNKDSGEEYLLMENLQAKGFKMADRKKGLDMEHTFELKGAYPAEYDRNVCSQEDSFKDFRETQTKAYVEAFPLYEASHLAKAVVRI